MCRTAKAEGLAWVEVHTEAVCSDADGDGRA